MVDAEQRDLLNIYQTLFKRGWLTQLWMLPLFLTCTFGFISFCCPVILLGTWLAGSDEFVSAVISTIIANVAFWVGLIYTHQCKKAWRTPSAFLTGTLTDVDVDSYYSYADDRRHTWAQVKVYIPASNETMSMSDHNMMGDRVDYFKGDIVYVACIAGHGKSLRYVVFKPEILRVEHRNGLFFLCGRSTYRKDQTYVRKLDESSVRGYAGKNGGELWQQIK